MRGGSGAGATVASGSMQTRKMGKFCLVLGSFKVTIIYIIICSIIFLININGVVKEFNNGVINGDFLIDGP